MLFGITVTIILYFVNIFDAITETKLIFNLIFIWQISKSIAKTYMSMDSCKCAFLR
jgi:uncharacterized membrane protein HdeD (DUF308 family)